MCTEIECSCSLSNLILHIWTSTQGFPIVLETV